MTRNALIFIFCLFAVPLSAQKALKPVKSALKDGKETDALKEILKLAKDSTINSDPRLYNYGVEANISLNSKQNEKAFLKQKYDTAQFFNTTYGIYEYALKTDSAERILLSKKGTKPKFQKANAEHLHKYYKNLCAGGRYYYIKKNYAEANKMLRMALDVPHCNMWGGNNDIINTKPYIENATLLIFSAFQQKEYPLVLKYKDLALRDTTAIRRPIIETLAKTYEIQHDTTQYLDCINLGLKEFPLHPYFFTELTDYHTGMGDYKASLELAETMLQTDSTNLYFLAAKALSLMNLGKDREAIDVSLKIIEKDSTNADIYYYTGAAYCNLAEAIQLPTNINSRSYKKANANRVELYQSALPFLEKYREMRPKEKEKWAPLLYKTYLALNKGDKFEEIEKIMSNIYSSKELTD